MEDDAALRESLTRVLEFEGYETADAANGSAALEAFDERRPSLVLLDIMMPYVDGLSVCRRIRARGDVTPILVLTARQEVTQRVEGLDAGADDYLAKPFALDELLARVRALLRRSSPGLAGAQLALDDLVMDTAAHTVERGGRELDLTKTEFAVLELLLENEGIVLTRDVLYNRIWGYEVETTSKALDMCVSCVRRKTEERGGTRLIHTVRGVGYVARI